MLVRIGKIVLVAGCLAGVAWLVVRLEPAKILAAVRAADPLLLALSIIPLPVRFLIWSTKATRIACRTGEVSSRSVLRLILAGALINLATPTLKLGGAVYRAAGIRAVTGWDRSTAWGWTLADQATNILGGLVLFGVCSLATGLALAPIHERGTSEQKQRYMALAVPGGAGQGEDPWRGAFCLTEPLPYVGVETGLLGGKIRIAEWDEGSEPILEVNKRGRFITGTITRKARKRIVYLIRCCFAHLFTPPLLLIKFNISFI